MIRFQCSTVWALHVCHAMNEWLNTLLLCLCEGGVSAMSRCEQVEEGTPPSRTCRETEAHRWEEDLRPCSHVLLTFILSNPTHDNSDRLTTTWSNRNVVFAFRAWTVTQVWTGPDCKYRWTRWQLPKVKPKHLNCPRVVDCSKDHKPHHLHVSRWEMDQTKN